MNSKRINVKKEVVVVVHGRYNSNKCIYQFHNVVTLSCKSQRFDCLLLVFIRRLGRSHAMYGWILEQLGLKTSMHMCAYRSVFTLHY